MKYTDRYGEPIMTKEGAQMRKEIEKQLSEMRMLDGGFDQMTRDLMKLKGFTIERLAEETGLSEETVKRMRNDPTVRFSIETVTAVCIAMHLSAETSRRYIDKSPAKFYDTVEMRMYNYALTQWYDHSVADVNRKLIESGAKPLTNLVSGLDVDVFAIPS